MLNLYSFKWDVELFGQVRSEIMQSEVDWDCYLHLLYRLGHRLLMEVQL